MLDCFAGTGEIWGAVQREHPEKEITVIKIDTQPKTPGTLKGNNLKYLQTLDIHQFDIIDLDAYGTPFPQCEIIFQRGFSGIVHVTSIQCGPGGGAQPDKMLALLGFPKPMLKKCPTLFSQKPVEKFLSYLAIRGVTEIEYFRFDRKFYGTFRLPPMPCK